MYRNLINIFNKFDKIVIFRHLRPDGDAIFSQFALYEFLKANFPNKEIQCFSNSSFDLMPYLNNVPDSFIEDSLAILLDTANRQRADTQSFFKAKYIVKIDHHPSVDDYGDLNIVNDKAVATCELLADIILSNEFINYTIPNKTLMYLYCGILTDSNCFRTSNTTSNSLAIASKLASKGNLDVASLANYVFNMSLNDFNKQTKVRNLLKVKQNVGYVIANQKTLDIVKLTKDEIKNQVDEFNSIKGLKIWGVFAYNKDTKLYDASVRSQKKYVINELCSKYNGGGHKNACGIRDLTLKEVKAIINALIDIANS